MRIRHYAIKTVQTDMGVIPAGTPLDYVYDRGEPTLIVGAWECEIDGARVARDAVESREAGISGSVECR